MFFSFLFSVFKNGKNVTILALILLIFASVGINVFLGLRLIKFGQENRKLQWEISQLKNQLSICNLSNKKQKQLLKSCSEKLDNLLSTVSNVELENLKRELKNAKGN